MYIINTLVSLLLRTGLSSIAKFVFPISFLHSSSNRSHANVWICSFTSKQNQHVAAVSPWAAAASRWTKTRATHLCYITFQRGITPDRTESPPFRESPDQLPTMSETRPLPPQVIYDGPSPRLLLLTCSGTDAPLCTLARDLVLLLRPSTTPCASKRRGLRNILLPAERMFGGSGKVKRGAAESNQSQDIGLVEKKKKHTWP